MSCPSLWTVAITSANMLQSSATLQQGPVSRVALLHGKCTAEKHEPTDVHRWRIFALSAARSMCYKHRHCLASPDV